MPRAQKLLYTYRVCLVLSTSALMLSCSSNHFKHRATPSGNVLTPSRSQDTHPDKLLAQSNYTRNALPSSIQSSNSLHTVKTKLRVYKKLLNVSPFFPLFFFLSLLFFFSLPNVFPAHPSHSGLMRQERSFDKCNFFCFFLQSCFKFIIMNE